MNIARVLIATTIFLFGVQDYFGQTTTPNTWYVRPDGGTRYSAAKPQGQCNGLANAPYPGSGVNQACAFNDVRYLWADGEYATTAGFPKWGWVGKGGDTYIIDCPTDCRVGYDGPGVNNYTNAKGYSVAIAGNPYYSGAPVPPSGTAAQPTQILGVNYENCADDSLKAHLNGGYGVNPVLNLTGASYVNVQCLDITDHSSCTRTNVNGCNTSYPLDDYATTGVLWSNTTTNVLMQDVRVHGMAGQGMLGPTGDSVSLARVAIVGNALSGWNMDRGDNTTGTGILQMFQVHILWNGCSEEYPLVDNLPYNYCTDDTSSGYGDGIGTATAVSNPGWTIYIAQSEAAYNTQDGFDLLHVEGSGSAVFMTQSLAYSNMGQQVKVGATSEVRNSLIVGNCNAMRQAIPGTPAGYDKHLRDFCRAANTAIDLGISGAAPTIFQYNTVLSDNATALELDCQGNCTAASSFVYRNNIFHGFADANNGNRYPGMLYTTINGLFTNPGTVISNNLSYHARQACPNPGWHEQNPVCADPLLANETYPAYGYGDMSLSAQSPAKGKGADIPGIRVDHLVNPRNQPPAIGAFEGMNY